MSCLARARIEQRDTQRGDAGAPRSDARLGRPQREPTSRTAATATLRISLMIRWLVVVALTGLLLLLLLRLRLLPAAESAGMQHRSPRLMRLMVAMLQRSRQRCWRLRRGKL